MTLEKLKEYVHESFENIRNALDIREKLLLRQIEVLFNHHHHNHNNNNNINNNFNAKQQQKQYSGNSLSSTSSSSSSIFNNNISATSSITTSSTSSSAVIKNQQQQFPTTTTTTKSISIDQIKFIPDNEENVLSNIRIFGKFNLDNFNFSNDNNSFTIIEDYICPNIDHEFMYKCLKNEIRTNNPNNNNNNYNYKYYNINNIKTNNNNNSNSKGNTLIIGKSGKKRTSKRNHQTKNQCNEIIIEFTNNKTLIRENPNIINDSKINTITLNESSDIIEKSTILNNNSNLNNDINLRKIDNISKSDNENNNNQNIINNCIGTINLNNNNSVPSPKHSKHSAKQTEYNLNINNNNCEFYNRLMTEIKNNFIKNNMSPAIFTASPNNSNNIKNIENNNNSNNKILFKNMDNLKLKIPTTKLMKHDVEIISANIEQQQIEEESEQKSTTTLSSYQIMHPIQIEQWLKQIVLETEIEPMQNIGILEHSNIN